MVVEHHSRLDAIAVTQRSPVKNRMNNGGTVSSYDNHTTSFVMVMVIILMMCLDGRNIPSQVRGFG